jgi:hypothetical protein
MKRPLIATALAIALAAGVFAEAELSKGSPAATVDGTFGAKEYQYDSTQQGVRVGATLGSDDMLYLAVEAKTSGYVALGVGGLVMNNSRLFLGAIQDGKPAFIEKLGKGHFYADAKDLVVKKWSVKTEGGKTTLELVLPASAALWKGKINATFAFSRSPKFDSEHAARGAIPFAVK